MMRRRTQITGYISQKIVQILAAFCILLLSMTFSQNEQRSYKGDLICTSSEISITSTLTMNDSIHYYSFRVSNFYQTSITLSTCGSEFNTVITVFDDLYSSISIASCIDHCIFCEDQSITPRNQILQLENVCVGIYYIQIQGRSQASDIGDYTLSISNCDDTQSPLLQNIHIQNTLTCDNVNVQTTDSVQGTTSANDFIQYFELELYEFQRSVLVSNCRSAFDTKLYVFSYNGMLLNECQDDCGYCSLNEEIVLNNLCPGKYVIEITGFSQLDYGDYQIAAVCGGNHSITENDPAMTGFLADTDANDIYYALCGFIILALCCLTCGIGIIQNYKRKRMLHIKGGENVGPQRLEYDSVISDDFDDEMVVPNQSFGEGGEEVIDSEVERNMIKYDMKAQRIESDEDGNPPIAFNAPMGILDAIDENGEMNLPVDKDHDKKHQNVGSFELLHHEFNPSIIRKESSKK